MKYIDSSATSNNNNNHGLHFGTSSLHPALREADRTTIRICGHWRAEMCIAHSVTGPMQLTTGCWVRHRGEALPVPLPRSQGRGIEVQALDAYVRIFFFLFCLMSPFKKSQKFQHQVKKKALTNIL